MYLSARDPPQAGAAFEGNDAAEDGERRSGALAGSTLGAVTMSMSPVISRERSGMGSVTPTNRGAAV
jgi:hypothetical protein